MREAINIIGDFMTSTVNDIRYLGQFIIGLAVLVAGYEYTDKWVIFLLLGIISVNGIVSAARGYFQRKIESLSEQDNKSRGHSVREIRSTHG